MIRNGKKEDQNVSKISNVTCYVKFRFFISTFFDFKEWKMKGQKAFLISNVTCHVKFRVPYLTSFDFRVLQMTCI